MNDKNRNRNRGYANRKSNQTAYEPSGSPEVLAKAVTDIGLKPETVDILVKGKVLTVKDIAVRTEQDMFKIQSFGKRQLFDVKNALQRLNVTFRPVPQKNTTETEGTNETAEQNKVVNNQAQNRTNKGEKPNNPNNQNSKPNNQNNKPNSQNNQNNKPNNQNKDKGTRNIENSKNQRPEKRKPTPSPIMEQTEQMKEVSDSVDKFYRKEKFVPVKQQEYREDRYKKFSRGGKFGFIDRTTNKEVIPPIYDEVAAFKEDLACVERNNLFGYINRQNDLVIPYKYECAMSFSEGLACVTLNNKSGYINKTGETVLQFIYDAATSFEEGKARVRLDGRWGLIDKSGTLRYL